MKPLFEIELTKKYYLEGFIFVDSIYNKWVCASRVERFFGPLKRGLFQVWENKPEQKYVKVEIDRNLTKFSIYFEDEKIFSTMNVFSHFRTTLSDFPSPVYITIDILDNKSESISDKIRSGELTITGRFPTNLLL